jgi:hypothetical protein
MLASRTFVRCDAWIVCRLCMNVLLSMISQALSEITLIVIVCNEMRSLKKNEKSWTTEHDLLTMALEIICIE